METFHLKLISAVVRCQSMQEPRQEYLKADTVMSIPLRNEKAVGLAISGR
jgi:hypothetical protein